MAPKSSNSNTYKNGIKLDLERLKKKTYGQFHNCKSQDFNLSVSNPNNKYVAYLHVLSQISNCQSLGRKNKHEILKTDRTKNKGRFN